MFRSDASDASDFPGGIPALKRRQFVSMVTDGTWCPIGTLSTNVVGEATHIIWVSGVPSTTAFLVTPHGSRHPRPIIGYAGAHTHPYSHWGGGTTRVSSRIESIIVLCDHVTIGTNCHLSSRSAVCTSGTYVRHKSGVDVERGKG